MEERLRSLFEYQRFEGNERLSGMLDDAMKRFEAGMQGEISDDDVRFLNAAGRADTPKGPKEKPL